MENHRKFERFNSCCSASVVGEGIECNDMPIVNFSASGLLLKGCCDFEVNDAVVVRFQGIGKNAGFRLQLHAKVMRKTEDSVALEVVDINQEAFSLLQTVILYCTIDPLDAALSLSETNDEISG